MAIGFARAEYKSRSAGGNAVRSAAYNARTEIRDQRTGERFDFTSKARAGDVHLGVLLPAGAKAEFSDSAALWNAVEKAERRKDSQVAREVVIALPKELGREDHIALARSFAEMHFVSKGLACQVDIHAPDADDVNWHAHILITTRRVTAQGLDAKKARDLDPAIVTAKGRAKVVSEEERWGQLWAAHQNQYFQAQGLDLRVDQMGGSAQEHLGPKRHRAPETQAARDERVEAEAQTLIAWRDPNKVLDLMTMTRSTFTTSDLDRELGKALPLDEERERVRAAVLAHPELVRLRDRDGAEIDRYTTTAVLDQERRALADAELIIRFQHRVGGREVGEAMASRTMRSDQVHACHAAWSGAGLVVIEGRAGVGKSYAIGAMAEAYRKSGHTVVGLGPTNLVGLELAAEPHINRGGTIHSELWHVEQGKRVWNARTVVIIDEAAMVDSKTLGRVLHEAARTGAKLILVGDDRQLASVERGGLFSVLRERYGVATIEKVTRQRQEWQREAAEDLAAGRHDRAVQAFADRGCVRWSNTQDEARAALVAQWAADTAGRPEKSRFVFAYTNDDVDALNADLRSVRRQRGELGADHTLQTDRGVRGFAVGDRVQITRTDKTLGMTNGTVGTVASIRQGHVIMRLDNGQQVGWHASQFGGFRHGYAGTIYKGQGRTIDETYLYHSHHWRSAASYVALTRQRDSALVFAATETAKDVAALARQMARADDRKAASAYVPEAEWLQQRAQEEAA
ncbi:MAG TPA: AAA family ATPase, partial [Ramlibacter sp.]|nr:AAA family ATPase [Ramlibacter sp.]